MINVTLRQAITLNGEPPPPDLPVRERYDVVVIGCGPVGATMLNCLAAFGVRSLGIERETGLYHKPRARHLDGEALRVMQNAGVADDLIETTFRSRGLRLVNADGDVLEEYEYSTTGPWPQGWPDSSNIHQPRFESILRAHIEVSERAAIVLGWEVIGYQQHADYIHVTARHVESGECVKWECQYLIACDGSDSTTRRAAGIRIEQLARDQDYLVIDAEIQGGSATLPDRPTLYCWPSRPHYFSPSTGFPSRWEFMVLDSDDRHELSSADGILRLLEPFAPRDRFVVHRSAIYTFHSRMADRWRDGRLFLAGDAAHTQPPFMAQGLCSGIRDCANLSWKIAYVLQKRATEDLLDTYQSERSVHARSWINEANRVGQIVMTTDPETAARRDKELMSRGQKNAIRVVPRLGPGLHTGRPPAGELSHQPVGPSGRRLDDTVGPRFLIAVTRELLRQSASAQEEIAARNGASVRVLLTDEYPESEKLLEHYRCSALVVRPDRYIMGTASDGAALAALVRSIPEAVKGSVAR